MVRVTWPEVSGASSYTVTRTGGSAGTVTYSGITVTSVDDGVGTRVTVPGEGYTYSVVAVVGGNPQTVGSATVDMSFRTFLSPDPADNFPTNYAGANGVEYCTTPGDIIRKVSGVIQSDFYGNAYIDTEIGGKLRTIIEDALDPNKV